MGDCYFYITLRKTKKRKKIREIKQGVPRADKADDYIFGAFIVLVVGVVT